MIQRIQTLLLLVAVICFVAACFMPVGHITSHDTYYRITPWVLKVDISDGKIIHPTYFIGMLQALLAIISFIAIFLYKKRTVQSKFCTAAIIVNFILIITMLWVYPNHVFPKITYLSGAEVEYSLWTLLSIVPLICLYFANKFIIRDEKMVRAADRLR
ncbi:MAG: DUF4293 domain-containing protein [Bacteroidales bacterium]|jgi:hypothetical protein|nr:DUF4293 domain-containing protein [Bacteroidales bacterium]